MNPVVEALKFRRACKKINPEKEIPGKPWSGIADIPNIRCNGDGLFQLPHWEPS